MSIAIPVRLVAALLAMPLAGAALVGASIAVAQEEPGGGPDGGSGKGEPSPCPSPSPGEDQGAPSEEQKKKSSPKGSESDPCSEPCPEPEPSTPHEDQDEAADPDDGEDGKEDCPDEEPSPKEPPAEEPGDEPGGGKDGKDDGATSPGDGTDGGTGDGTAPPAGGTDGADKGTDGTDKGSAPTDDTPGAGDPTDDPTTQPSPDPSRDGTPRSEPRGDRPRTGPRQSPNVADTAVLATGLLAGGGGAGVWPAPSGAYSTDLLVAVAERLRREGWSEERIVAEVYPPFIVAGQAAWSDTWGAPRYGPGRVVRTHEGQDVFCEEGTPVLAPEDGVVEFGTEPLGGRVARLHRAGGGYFYLAHLSDWNGDIRSGASVRTGDVIGYCGNTGNAERTAPHVHFGWYEERGVARDPMGMLVRWLRQAEARAATLVGDTVPEIAAASQAVRTAPRPEAVARLVLGAVGLDGGGSPADAFPRPDPLGAVATFPAMLALRHAIRRMAPVISERAAAG